MTERREWWWMELNPAGGWSRVVFSRPITSCSSLLNGIPSSQWGLSPPSSMQSLSASIVPNFFGLHTSLLAISTYRVGQDLSNDLGTLAPEAPQCSGGQHNDQPTWRPHFPFHLRTHLRWSLFKLFAHHKHPAIFFSSFKNMATKGPCVLQIKVFLPVILQSPMHTSPSSRSCCGSVDRPTTTAAGNRPRTWHRVTEVNAKSVLREA